MKLRIAKKILKAFDSVNGVSRHSNDLVHRALERMDRTKSKKMIHDQWDSMIRYLGPEGRAHILAGTGRPDMALGLLMRTPEEKWAGDPSAWPFGDRHAQKAT